MVRFLFTVSHLRPTLTPPATVGCRKSTLYNTCIIFEQWALFPAMQSVSFGLRLNFQLLV